MDSTLQKNSLSRQIINSIRGQEEDYTLISIRKAIILLAIPMVLEMIMESVFALVDMVVVSSLGDKAISVVGITESILTIIYALGLGVGMGATGLISRRIGEKRIARASIASCQSINLGVVLSLPVIILGLFFPAKILALMHAEPQVIEIGTSYTSIMLTGNILIMLLFINNAIFRSAGNPALSFRVLFIANLINIILDPCLVFGWSFFPEMGVKGAAVATNIGRGIGVIYQFYMLFSGKGTIKIKLSYFKVKLITMWKVLYLSAGGILQFVIATSSWILLYRILATYGSSVIAGYTIAIRAFVFFLLPAWGLSNAASTLVGQNLGAKNPQRAEKSVWYTAIVNLAYMLLVFILFEVFTHSVIRVFQTTNDSFPIAVHSLRIISYGLLFYGLGMVMAQAFNGAGDTFTPTLINFIGFWILELPLAYYLSHKAGMGADGVFYSVLIAESFIAILGILLFLRGKWKLREL